MRAFAVSWRKARAPASSRGSTCVATRLGWDSYMLVCSHLKHNQSKLVGLDKGLIMKHTNGSGENSQPPVIPSPIPRVNILGVGVTPVSLMQTVEILEKWRAEGRREYVCCCPVHGLVEA